MVDKNKFGVTILTKKIGIDPGKSNGFAIMNNDKLELFTFDFWECIKAISDNTDAQFFIENPNLNKPVFWKQKKSVNGFNPATKIAQNIGQNKMIAELLISYCKKNNINVTEVRPMSKKWTSHLFKQITGIKKSNQHQRDAAKLII